MHAGCRCPPAWGGARVLDGRACMEFGRFFRSTELGCHAVNLTIDSPDLGGASTFIQSISADLGEAPAFIQSCQIFPSCSFIIARVGGQRIRRLFTPFDARPDFILGTDCGRHGGRLQNPRTLPHARGPSACGNLRGSLRLQGVRAQSVPRSWRAAARATAAPSTAGEDQEGLRLCGLEGRRSMQ